MLDPNVNLAVILLVPIVPAYTLFKALKSTGTLDGVWHGLNLQLGGAFAGYFALVLLVLYSHNIWASQATPMYVVTGQLVDGNNGQPVDLSTILVNPPCVKTLPDGEFTIYFSPVPGPAGNVEYPLIQVNHKEYAAMNIPLDPSRREELPKSVQITRTGNIIDLHAIRLSPIRLSNYAPTGPPPQRVSVFQELKSPPEAPASLMPTPTPPASLIPTPTPPASLMPTPTR